MKTVEIAYRYDGTEASLRERPATPMRRDCG